jgi:hypothetical protein
MLITYAIDREVFIFFSNEKFEQIECVECIFFTDDEETSKSKRGEATSITNE